MFDYVRSKATADRLITKYGQTAVLRRFNPTGAAYDPVVGRAVDEYSVNIVVMDYTDFEVGQGRVKASDKRVYLAKGDLDFDPTPLDRLIIGGEPHAIVGPNEGRGVRTLSPAGVPVMYELQCRR